MAAAAGGAGHVRGVRGGEGLDSGPGQGGQQGGAAAGRPPWPAGGGGQVEPGADVAFEPAELVAQRGGADTQAGGRGGDGGGGHGGLEPAQPAPACRAVLGRAADVAGNLVAGFGGVAGAGEVLFGQLARAGRGGAELAGHGDAVLAGDLGEETAGDPGVGFQLAEVLARGDVLAVEELAGQDAAGALLPLPCQGRGGPAPLPCGPGDAVEREPEVAAGGAQLGGGLGDAEVVQGGGGVAVQRVPQPGGEGAGEGVVAAVVVGAGEGEGVPGVVQ